MPTYKLYYFNARGGGEAIRLIFAQAGVEYEDVRFPSPTADQWREFKPKTPFGVLPVLEVDGKLFGGSRPIARYLGQQLGLAGGDDEATLVLDGAVDAIYDAHTNYIRRLLFEDIGGEGRAALMKEVEEKILPRYYGGLNELAAANSCPDGWFYGPKVTYADLIFACMVTFTTSVYPNVLDQYPALKKLKTSVENLPNIAKWLRERPVTEY